MNMGIACLVSLNAFALVATAETPLPWGYTHAALMKWATTRDFKTQTKDGVEVHCRPVTPLGTHLPVRQCLTEARLAQAKHATDTAGPGPPSS